MRIFYDTEFFEDGTIIDLISIGMHAEDGRELYMVNGDFDTQRMLAHPNRHWLFQNVFSSIRYETITDGGCAGMVDFVITDTNAQQKSIIAQEVVDFLSRYNGDVELWAYYAAYDHVALAQLWGRMLEMPSAVVPMYTNDIMTLSAMKGHPSIPAQVVGNHNALNDARHNKVVYDYLKGL